MTAWIAAAQRTAPDSSPVPLVVDAPAPTALIAFPGLGNAIKDAYNFVEYWVDYGVDVAAYAVGWLPFGWVAADQIQIFYNSLIEPVARTITFNIADWVGGSQTFLQGLNNVVLDSANAGIGFLNAEIAWGWGLLPPLPFPPPQIPTLPWFTQTQTVTTSATALTPGETTGTGVAATAVRQLRSVVDGEKTVPEVVRDGVEGVAHVVRDRVAERRATRSTLLAGAADVDGNRVVRAQGEVRGPVIKAVTDFGRALQGRGGADGRATTTSGAAIKNLGATARKVVKDVRQAAKDARQAAKDARQSSKERSGDTDDK
ncbi:hypothetical protein MAGR_67480 [Mycolicibacterium agri]|uniref:Uncharacterized protein n=1 Tax=Mycolicibacterium agri TaxID=36811 RepID=A0A7I9WDE7_MYCAG|nr:hypothetical protein MAGR_67480 [Mycolicibacterium agri]